MPRKPARSRGPCEDAAKLRTVRRLGLPRTTLFKVRLARQPHASETNLETGAQAQNRGITSAAVFKGSMHCQEVP